MNEKYRFLFNNFKCKFTGLSSETEEGYIKVMKDLGAEVSNSATYNLTDELYISKNKHKVFTDLYNITYIIDSIQAGEPLDISLYRFECENSLQVDDNESMNVDETSNVSDVIQIKKKIKLDECAIVKDNNDIEMHDETLNVLTSDESTDEKQLNNTYQQLDIKTNESMDIKNKDKEILMESCSDIKQEPNAKEIMYYNFDSQNINTMKTNVKANDVKHININSDDSDSSVSDIFLDSDEEEKKQRDNDKKWWQRQDLSDNEICTVKSCSYEPGRHEKHESPRRMMSMTEKKILLKYLIMTSSISQAKGRKIWHLMHDARYLVHRTVESLRNCLRRTILPSITSYGLPPHILNKFLELNK